jgi:hypothetical protein
MMSVSIWSVLLDSEVLMAKDPNCVALFTY